MHKHYLASCLTILFFFSLEASAQTAAADRTAVEGQSPAQPGSREKTDPDLPRSSDPGKQPFLRTFAHDEWRMWSSPFRRSSYESHALTKYVVPFAILSTVLIANDRKIVDVLPNTRDQTKWSGRVSQLGASYTLAGGAGAMYLLGKAIDDKHARETGWLGLLALGHTSLVTFGMKQITNRHRPETSEIGRGFWNGGDSFPSGHAATSFALAAVVSYEYRDHIAVPIAAYTVATLISASRVSARRHWASDIVVGGATGFLIGRYIYRQHHDPNLPGSPVHRGAVDRLMPEVGFGLNGPTLTWGF